MKKLMRIVPFLMLAALPLLPACSEKRVPTTQPAVLGANGMEELAEVCKFLADQKLPPPRKLEDLIDREPSLPTAWGKLQSGEYVMAWGVGLAKGDKSVLCYEKKAAAEGGLVLLRDGTVLEMTAGEFKSAPKAR